MNKDEARRELLKSLPGSLPGGTAIVTLGAERQDGDGGDSAVQPELSRVLGELSGQVALMTSASRAVETAIQANTRATWENTESRGNGGAREALSKAGSGLSSWFGFSPIALGLQALLGRGKPEAEPALARLDATPAAHRALHPTWGVWESGASAGAVSHGQLGLPRPVVQSAAPQVTVQVNAMDSRSFLDNSDQIARAVREAILNSRALADVVGEY
jgi:hypothetical protein